MEGFWASFRLDPRAPAHASMRASDADREAVRTVLAEAYADGRLTRQEYDERLNTLYASRTLGELPPLVNDLEPLAAAAPAPAPLPAAELRQRGARTWRKEVEESFGAFLIPSIICVVIWAVGTGGGFFWPAFPMLFLGLNLLRTVVQRESVIEREVLRLQEQAAQDSAPELPAQDSAPELPAQDKTPELPAQDKTPELPAQDKTPEPPAQNSAAGPPPQARAAQSPPQDRAAQPPAEPRILRPGPPADGA